MASNAPKTKRDTGGQESETQKGKDKPGSAPPSKSPAKPSGKKK